MIKLDIRLNCLTNDNEKEKSRISVLIVNGNEFYCANAYSRFMTFKILYLIITSETIYNFTFRNTDLNNYAA